MSWCSPPRWPAAAERRVRGTDSEGGGNLLLCHWGPDDGTAPSADLELSTTREPAASDRGWQLLGRLRGNAAAISAEMLGALVAA